MLISGRKKFRILKFRGKLATHWVNTSYPRNFWLDGPESFPDEDAVIIIIKIVSYDDSLELADGEGLDRKNLSDEGR